MVTFPLSLPVLLGNLSWFFSLWEAGGVLKRKILKNMGVPIKSQKFLTLKSVCASLQQFSKFIIYIFLPVNDSRAFYSGKQISRVTLDLLVSPDFRAVIWPVTSLLWWVQQTFIDFLWLFPFHPFLTVRIEIITSTLFICWSWKQKLYWNFASQKLIPNYKWHCINF